MTTTPASNERSLDLADLDGRRRTESVVSLALLTATLLAALPALGIVGLLVVRGAPALSADRRESEDLGRDPRLAGGAARAAGTARSDGDGDVRSDRRHDVLMDEASATTRRHCVISDAWSAVAVASPAMSCVISAS